MKKNSFLLFCHFLFFFQTIAQDTTLIKRKLNIEFSLSTVLSNFELEHTFGEEIAKPYSDMTIGIMLRFNYEINKKHSIGFGFNHYLSVASVDFILDKDKYQLPWQIEGPEDYNIRILSFPITYAYSIPLTKTLIFKPAIAYNLSIPISFIIFSDVDVNSSLGDSTNFYTANYLPNKFFNHGIWIEMGIKKLLKNKNELKLSFIKNIAFQKNLVAKYTFFPDRPKHISKGKIKKGFGFIGLSLSYILTHKKKKNKIEKI